VPSIKGTPPSSAHIVVIKIGRKRSRHASWIASSVLSPRSRSPTSAKSTSMMPFFLTMPISRMIPMMPITSSGMPNNIRVSNAPSPAEGKVEMIVIGWIVLS
jgi:hypothetical protein